MTEHEADGQLTTKHWLIMFLSIVAIIATFVIVLLFTDNRRPVDVNQYLIVNSAGFNGYGSISATIDYNKLIDDNTTDNRWSGKTKEKATAICANLSPFVAQYNQSNTLSNGDVVNISWKRNEAEIEELAKLLNVKFDSDVFEYTVNGLSELQNYDPFKDLTVTINNAVSGQGDLRFSISPTLDNSNTIWNVSHDGVNGSLKNGDTIILSISDNIDIDGLARDRGIKITKTSDQYVVSCLSKYAKGDEILQHIGDNERSIFNRVIEDWVVVGLNDESKLKRPRTYEPAGYLFYTNDEQTEEAAESMLFCIYKIQDNYVFGGYYVFIGLKGVFSFSDSCVFRNGKALPTSFVHYEKETVRCNEELEWEQNCEPMGFLYYGAAYAGHRDIQETFGYIESVYGVNYSTRYVSDDIKDIVPTR